MYSLHSIKSLYCRWLYLPAIAGLLMMVLFVSCRKEPRDTVPPAITITAPSGGQTFYYQNIIFLILLKILVLAVVSSVTKLLLLVIPHFYI
jgi:hypothetical protein